MTAWLALLFSVLVTVATVAFAAGKILQKIEDMSQKIDSLSKKISKHEDKQDMDWNDIEARVSFNKEKMIENSNKLGDHERRLTILEKIRGLA